MKEHLGGIYEFLQYRKLENLKEIEAQTPRNETKEPSTTKEVRLSYEQQKELSRKRNKIEKIIKDAEAKIEALEHEIADIEAEISSCDNNRAIELSTLFEEKNKQLENEMQRWEEASEQLFSLQ